MQYYKLTFKNFGSHNFLLTKTCLSFFIHNPTVLTCIKLCLYSFFKCYLCRPFYLICNFSTFSHVSISTSVLSELKNGDVDSF